MRASSPLAPPPEAIVPPPRLHLDFLDGIRALAAFYVVVHHLYLSRFGMSARTQWPGVLGNSLLYGHLAVGVFLVVSGFCLGLPVTATRQLARGPLAFYGKRARRILPPFFMALIGSVLVFWLRHRFAGGESLSGSAFVFNVLLLQDIFPASNIFDPPLWSVATEWKIYFLFPVFLWAWRRFGTAGLLGAGILGASLATLLWLRFGGSSQTWGHSCPWFLALFAFGVAAAHIARSETRNTAKWRQRMPPVALGSLCALAILLYQFPVTGRGEFERFVPALPWIDGMTGILTAALLIILAHQKSAGSTIKRVLEWRPLVGVGTFAYSLYLTHEPLIRVLNFVLERAPFFRSSPTLATVALALVGLPLLVGAAYLFFLVFERPFLSRRANT